mmetsp:Transcript_57561/g.70326  ORF Transcript_57561/g.70326 Transcript_57561/m.70326 type:complete len:144 (+) Transcript_57561:57-488(+)
MSTFKLVSFIFVVLIGIINSCSDEDPCAYGYTCRDGFCKLRDNSAKTNDKNEYNLFGIKHFGPKNDWFNKEITIQYGSLILILIALSLLCCALCGFIMSLCLTYKTYKSKQLMKPIKVFMVNNRDNNNNDSNSDDNDELTRFI